MQVPTNTGKHDLIAVMGHELQHAMEVRSTPTSRQRGLAALYRLIGLQAQGWIAIDTAAARSIGRRVRAELLE